MPQIADLENGRERIWVCEGAFSVKTTGPFFFFLFFFLFFFNYYEDFKSKLYYFIVCNCTTVWIMKVMLSFLLKKISFKNYLVRDCYKRFYRILLKKKTCVFKRWVFFFFLIMFKRWVEWRNSCLYKMRLKKLLFHKIIFKHYHFSQRFYFKKYY